MRKKRRSSPVLTRQDIRDLSAKIDRNQKALDQLDHVGRIIRENEKNLRNLSGLQHRLDTLDKIFVTVDKMAGDMQPYRQEQELNAKQLSDHEDRLETVEKHIKITSVS